MDINDLNGKSIALIVWNIEKENDVHVYVGSLTFQDEECIFRNDTKGWLIHIQREKLNELKKVTEDLKRTLLYADYFINLTIGDIKDNQGSYFPTGLKWDS